MEHKRRLFIYDRKEVGVLIFLGLGVALFAFTLGVHLGKEVSPKPLETAEHGESGEESHEAVATTSESAPNRTEVAEQVKGAPEAADESLEQSLRDEVAKTGLQVDEPKALALPEETKAEKTETAQPAAHAEPAHAPAKKPAAVPGAGTGTFTLQVGSFPSLEEAQPTLTKMIEQGLPAETREVDLKGKGKWFRVYVGRFASLGEAEKAGQDFKKEKRIRAFVVVKAQ